MLKLIRKLVCMVFLAALAAFITVGVTGCVATKPELTKSADDVEPAIVVQSIDNRYEPETVTIKVGEAVKWQSAGTAKHDVVEENGLFVSELSKDGSFTHVFTEPGTYKYHCSIHPEMRGTVIVE